MPFAIDKPRSAADISGWILRQAVQVENGRELVDGLGEALAEAGLSLLRLGISLATLNIAHRGVTFDWQPGKGTRLTRMAHGAQGDVDFARSPISVLLAENRRSGRWRVDAGEGCERFPCLPNCASTVVPTTCLN